VASGYATALQRTFSGICPSVTFTIVFETVMFSGGSENYWHAINFRVSAMTLINICLQLKLHTFHGRTEWSSLSLTISYTDYIMLPHLCKICQPAQLIMWFGCNSSTLPIGGSQCCTAIWGVKNELPCFYYLVLGRKTALKNSILLTMLWKS
jgi:hypothetical protein